MQFLQKYENVEKTFWKRWLSRLFFLQRFQKRFGNVQCVFSCTLERKRIENEKKRWERFCGWPDGQKREKKRKKNEMETSGAFSRGCRSSLCAAFSSCEAYGNAMKTYENASKTQWKRIENVIHSKFPPNRVFKNAQDVLKTFWAFLKFFGGPFENAKYVLKRPPRFQESFRDFFLQKSLENVKHVWKRKKRFKNVPGKNKRKKRFKNVPQKTKT